MAKSCKKCLLDTRVPGITIGHNGLCVYCNGDKAEPWDLRFKVTQEVKNRLRAELDNIFAENRGKYSYDCILALSGGKDSSYLLYQLVKERRLKVLAVHVKTIFESDAAAINIERLRDKLNFDLKKIYPGDAFYKELYSKLLLHPQNTNFIDSVCPICTEIWMGYCLRIALENKIPLVLTGFSPPQFYFFELPRDIIEKKNWIPDLLNSGEYNKEFLDNFWDPGRYPKGTVFPRVISPLHVMEYNIREIRERFSQNKILSKRMSDRLQTACKLGHILIALDQRSFGYQQDILWQSYLIRKGMLGENKNSFLNKIKRRMFQALYPLYVTAILAKQVGKRLDIDFDKILLGCNKHGAPKEFEESFEPPLGHRKSLFTLNN